MSEFKFMSDEQLSEALAKIEAMIRNLAPSDTVLGRQLLHRYIAVGDEALAECERRGQRAA